MAFAVPKAVSILDAIVIYLSVGAPFGVLRFFSDRNRRHSAAMLLAAGAVLAWPFFAVRQLFSLLTKRTSEPLEETGQGHSPEFSLFVISGHPRPELASVCYRRARRKVLRGRSFGKTSDTSKTGPTYPVTTREAQATKRHKVPARSTSFPV